MTWWNKLTQSNKAQTKHSRVAHLIAANTLNQPVWTPRRFDKLTQEGYQKNPIVYRAVSLISRGVAGVSWHLSQNGQKLDNHPLLRLIQYPNPSQGFPRFMEALTSYLLLSGNTYLEAVGATETGIPLELHLLRPDRVRIIPGTDGLPAAYEYQVADKSRRIGNGSPSPILHIKNFHPLNDWYGMSPLEAAASAIDQHNTVSEHNLSLLQNSARPSGALLYRGDPMSKLAMENAREQLWEHYLEGKNTGLPLLLQGNVEWRELGLSPKDMDYINGKYLSAREIAQAFGVPSMLVGVPGDATFANYREARYHLWEDTILPLMESLKEDLNNWLLSFYGEAGRGIQLDYDTESIAALTPKRESAWAKIAEADFLSMNEKRTAVGYPEIPEGNKVIS